jgi:hypothetical protein
MIALLKIRGLNSVKNRKILFRTLYSSPNSKSFLDLKNHLKLTLKTKFIENTYDLVLFAADLKINF